MKNATIKALLALLATTVFTFADTETIQPDGTVSEDAYVWEYQPTNNYGGDAYMSLGYFDGYCSFYIDFEEITDYMGDIVNSATLNLYALNGWGDPTDANVVTVADNTWTENNITWNNAPGWNLTYLIYFDTPDTGSWVNIDVTDIVSDWLDGTYPIYGFMLFHDSTGYGGRNYYSGEYSADPTLRPYLYLDYTGTAVEAVSLGEIKATFK